MSAAQRAGDEGTMKAARNVQPVPLKML